MALKIQDGQTILFIGDSITDCGRRAEAAPLGNGYVKLFADLLAIREPAKKVRVINKGIGGDRVTGLRERWTDDVMRYRPDWLSVKIGINDLHAALRDLVEPVPPELFEKAYDEILARTAVELPECWILLIDPFYISTERSPGTFRQAVLDALPAYVGIVHRMSRKHKTRLVKTHAMFQRLLEHHETEAFAPEPVHPHLTGHLAIAEAVYQALSK